MFIIGFTALAVAFALFYWVAEVRSVPPSLNLRPLFGVLCLAGVVLPLIAIIAEPKALLVPAIVYFCLLFTTFQDRGPGWGTFSNTWRSTGFGWPTKYLVMHYHKGGKWVEQPEGTQDWVPYIDRSWEVVWWESAPVLAASVAATLGLSVPRRLLEKGKANNYLNRTGDTLREPPAG